MFHFYELFFFQESVRARFPQLIYEARLLKYLQGGDGICKVYHCCTEHDFHLMVMELLGNSLEDVFTAHNRHFSIETICQIGIQMLHRVEYLHTKSFIHRDIKPDNFLIGQKENKGKVHMIDLGLAKKYRDPRTGTHIVYRDNKNLTGTARYASINAHLGVEQSRRDDLEAIGYVLLYFAKNGMLPWQGIQAENKQEKYQRIMEKKMCLPVDVLCRGCPGEFSVYLYYCRALRFEDQPDYQYLRGHFKRLIDRRCPTIEPPVDWINDADDPNRQPSLTSGLPSNMKNADGPKREISRQNTNNSRLNTPPNNARHVSQSNLKKGGGDTSPRLSVGERMRSVDSRGNNSIGNGAGNRRTSKQYYDTTSEEDDDFEENNINNPQRKSSTRHQNEGGRAYDPNRDLSTSPKATHQHTRQNSLDGNTAHVAPAAIEPKRAGFFTSLARMCGCGKTDNIRYPAANEQKQIVTHQQMARNTVNHTHNSGNNNNLHSSQQQQRSGHAHGGANDRSSPPAASREVSRQPLSNSRRNSLSP